jgi:hypothetical protein
MSLWDVSPGLQDKPLSSRMSLQGCSTGLHSSRTSIQGSGSESGFQDEFSGLQDEHPGLQDEFHNSTMSFHSSKMIFSRSIVNILGRKATSRIKYTIDVSGKTSIHQCWVSNDQDQFSDATSWASKALVWASKAPDRLSRGPCWASKAWD